MEKTLDHWMHPPQAEKEDNLTAQEEERTNAVEGPSFKTTHKGEIFKTRGDIVLTRLYTCSQGLPFEQLFYKMRPDRFTKEELRNCLVELERQKRVVRTGEWWVAKTPGEEVP